MMDRISTDHWWLHTHTKGVWPGKRQRGDGLMQVMNLIGLSKSGLQEGGRSVWMTGLIKRTHIHADKHTMHLIKQQHFGDSRVHLCNIKMGAYNTRTHTTAHACVLPYFCSARDYNRLGKKEERGRGRDRHTHNHITHHIQAFRGRGLEWVHSVTKAVT